LGYRDFDGVSSKGNLKEGGQSWLFLQEGVRGYKSGERRRGPGRVVGIMVDEPGGDRFLFPRKLTGPQNDFLEMTRRERREAKGNP